VQRHKVIAAHNVNKDGASITVPRGAQKNDNIALVRSWRDVSQENMQNTPSRLSLTLSRPALPSPLMRLR
jgi:hypothetical protein